MLGDAKKVIRQRALNLIFLFCNCDHGNRTFGCVLRAIEDNAPGLARADPKLEV